jgi:hypothetical protein
MGTSLVVTVSPDVLNQDGVSQSLVQIQAYDNNGQPLRNASLRVATEVDGAITDFGRLSAKDVVTDVNGRTSITYTAPAAVPGISSTINVDILVTPSETDFNNATTRHVTIHLVPTGIVGPPGSSFTPDFTVPSATVGDPVTFTATASGTSANAAVAKFVWDFGDGDKPVGQTVQHTFDEAGSPLVKLTLVDTLGRTSSVTRSVTVTLPATGLSPDFLWSPIPVQLNQPVHFDASISTVTAPHRIVSYTWNFGEGTVITTGSPRIDFTYQLPRTYDVVLTATDDTGQTKTVHHQISPS